MNETLPEKPESNAPRDQPGLVRGLIEAVTEAGTLARQMFAAGVRNWRKSKNSPVTEADIAVDELLRRRLLAMEPTYGWLSEETADAPERLDRTRVWVVDPIDGTRAFIDGGTDWVVAAALVEEGRPLAAALFAPLTQELFVAERARGATRNGIPIRARAGIGAELQISGPRRTLARLSEVGIDARPPSPIRSLALRLARVASGERDAAFSEHRSYDWDLAAADLLVHEAGGIITTLTGHILRYNQADPVHNSVVCAGLRLHPILLAAINRVSQTQRRNS